MATDDRPVLFSVDFGECGRLAGLEPGEIAARFSAALERAGATIEQTVSHTYPGQGLTCVLVLRESHAVVHTWPETGTVNLDIFSCSSRLRSPEAIEELSRFFGARRISVQEIQRADGHRPR